MALKMYGACVLCALPLTSMAEFTVLPHTLWLGDLPRSGPCETAARGSSMTLGAPHCTHINMHKQKIVHMFTHTQICI